jgi:VCBS repeat-containing protein
MSAAIAHATQTVAPVTIAAIGPTTTAAWSVNPLVTRLGLPYPAQITAPVTTRSIITDMLGWIGLGALNPRVPGPAMPVSDFVAGVWVGIRRIHYTLWNSHPTLSLTTATTDPVKAVVTGNLGGADVDGDVLTYAVSNPSKGTVEIAEDGTYTYTPDAEFAHTGGTDSFVASVSDTANPWHRYGLAGVVHHLVRQLAWAGVMNPDTKIVRVTVPVGFVNAAPIVEAASVGAASPSTGAVLGTVATSDADGDTVTFTTKTAPLRGAVQLNSATGAFTYTPNPVARHAASAQGAAADALIDTFTLEIADGYGGTTLVPVTVAIAPANANPVAAAPTIGNPNVTTGAVAGALSITDADGDAATYPAAVSTAKGTAVIAANGTFVYTPNANARHAAAADNATAAERTDTFTVTISDGHGGTTAAVVTVAVGPFNTNPVAGTPTVATADAATGVIVGSLAATDADGDTTAFVAITAPSRGTLSLNQSTGAFTYTPDASARHGAAADGATGTDIADTFTLAVTDGHGGTTLVPVTVDILPANTAPAFSTPTVGDPSGSTGAVTGALAITDAEGDTPTYSIVDGPLNGTVTIDPATGLFVYTPNADARHDAARESGSTGTGLQTITLSNPAAVTMGTYGGWTSGVGTYNYVATYFTAAETGTYIFGQTSAPVDTVMEIYSGTFNPSAPGVGRLAVNDDTGLSAHVDAGATVTGCAGSTGLCPQVTANLTAGQVITLVVTTFSAGAPLGLPQSFYSNRGGTFAATAPGDSFTVAVNDGHGGITTSRISVPILPANVAPTAVASTGTPDGSTGAVAGALAVSDADGDTTAVAAVTTPTRGTLTVDPATGAFTYTPDPSARHAAAADGASAAERTDTFTLGVTDGHGGTIAVPVSVVIDPTNTDPTAGTTTLGDPDAAGTIAGRLAVTDADGDALTYRGSGTSASGAFVINPDGSFTYTPTADALAAAGSGTTDSFSITVDDGHGGVVAVPVTVTIAAGNNSSPGTPPAGCPTNCADATVTFTGGTAFFAGGPGTTNGTDLYRDVDYYVENGFVFDYIGGSGGDVGDYYGTGNDVIHAHWGVGEMTSIEIRKDGGGSFNFNYFVLTSNTLAPGGSAQGTEQVFIQGFLNGTATGPQVLLAPEDWGFPASSVFTGTAFDSVDKVVITSTNGSFSCFGMDSFYIDSISV